MSIRRWFLNGSGKIKKLAGRRKAAYTSDSPASPANGVGCNCDNVFIVLLYVAANSGTPCLFDVGRFRSSNCPGSVVYVQASWDTLGTFPTESYTLAVTLADTSGWATLFTGTNCTFYYWVNPVLGTDVHASCRGYCPKFPLNALIPWTNGYMDWTGAPALTGRASCDPAAPPATANPTVPNTFSFANKPSWTEKHTLEGVTVANAQDDACFDGPYQIPTFDATPGPATCDDVLTIDVSHGTDPITADATDFGVTLLLEREANGVTDPGTNHQIYKELSSTSLGGGSWRKTAYIRRPGTWRLIARASASQNDVYSSDVVITHGAPVYIGFLSNAIGGGNIWIPGQKILMRQNIDSRGVIDDIHIPPGTTNFNKWAQHFTIADSIKVALYDQWFNVCTTATNSISIAIHRFNTFAGINVPTLVGVLTKNAINGIATFDDIEVTGLGFSYQLDPSSSGLATSGGLNPNIPVELKFIPEYLVPQTVKAGDKFDVQVTLKDYHGNVLKPDLNIDALGITDDTNHNGHVLVDVSPTFPVDGIASFRCHFPAAGKYALKIDPSGVHYRGVPLCSPIIEVI